MSTPKDDSGDFWRQWARYAARQAGIPDNLLRKRSGVTPVVTLPLDDGDPIASMEDAQAYPIVPGTAFNPGQELIVFSASGRCFWIAGIPENVTTIEVPQLLEAD